VFERASSVHVHCAVMAVGWVGILSVNAERVVIV